MTIPQNGSELAKLSGIAAAAYVVADASSGEALIAKDADVPRVPASLTKLVTALAVLDAKTKLTKQVAMTKQDQISGMCGQGGACIKSASGVKFTVDGLFHAALIPSANNAALALARSTGLPPEKFVERMNQKAKSLGAKNTVFYEPTGLDPRNTTTASDYAKIVAAAFKNPYLKKVAGKTQYYLRSSNNYRYRQTIKNTDKLLKDEEVRVFGAKTGYLDEAGYNFASLIQYRGGQKLAIVVLGERHLYSAFEETKQLASMAEDAKSLAWLNQASVLGASTAHQ